jgi:hypothetical protein
MKCTGYFTRLLLMGTIALIGSRGISAQTNVALAQSPETGPSQGPTAQKSQPQPDINMPSLSASTPFAIQVLSTRPEWVSGGDALVRILADKSEPLGKVVVQVNNRDVTSLLKVDADQHSLTGLVSGLTLGQNTLRVTGAHKKTAELSLTNYPLTGPIMSGPHEVPFVCLTQDFVLPDNKKYGDPTSANCSAPTKITYLYMPTGGTALKPLPDLKNLPSDMSKTTTTTGVTVNFIVRVETSTVDRGIYESAILHDPTTEPEPAWNASPKGWNKRLIAIEGFGCAGGWYMQGTVEGSLLPNPATANMDLTLLSPARLGEGYALFANTLQNPSNNCNSVLSRESAVMSKEHFIKTYGVPLYTVTEGCSGGSYGGTNLADAIPGLFDGAFIACTFPDPLAIAFSGSDAHLLTHFFATHPSDFTPAQQTAISGYKGQQAFFDAANQAQRTDPIQGRVDIDEYKPGVWNPSVPADLRYDPVTNPGGARPDIYDVAKYIYGVDPSTGFAQRPFDNVGVQYGLGSLKDGTITPGQFVALNKGIGGFDQDDNYIPARVVGNPQAIERAYQSGLQMNAKAGLSTIPVFDISGIYNDDGKYHYQWFHFAMRERMQQSNGVVANHVMWRGNPVPFDKAWALFIQWQDAIAIDHMQRSPLEKVVANKPAAAIDGCWSTPSTFIGERQTFGRLPDSQCNTLYPSFAFPRYIAGGPLAADIIKCQLKPLNPADYSVTFSPAEWADLQQAFPSGVCDWTKPGQHQVDVIPFGSFGPSPVHLIPAAAELKMPDDNQ